MLFFFRKAVILTKSKADLAKPVFYFLLTFAPTKRNRNMNTVNETKVAIIGAGVSGLTLAAFLQKSGIPCVVLERRNRGLH